MKMKHQIVAMMMIGISILSYFGYFDSLGALPSLILISNSTDVPQKTWIANGTIFMQYPNGTITTAVPFMRQYWYMFGLAGVSIIMMTRLLGVGKSSYHYDYTPSSSEESAGVQAARELPDEEEDTEDEEADEEKSLCGYCGRMTVTTREGGCPYCGGSKNE